MTRRQTIVTGWLFMLAAFIVLLTGDRSTVTGHTVAAFVLAVVATGILTTAGDRQ